MSKICINFLKYDQKQQIFKRIQACNLAHFGRTNYNLTLYFRYKVYYAYYKMLVKIAWSRSIAIYAKFYTLA